MLINQLLQSEFEELRILEESLWKNENRYNLDFQESVFAPDCFEFGSSGRVYARQDMIRAEGYDIVAVLSLMNFSVKFVDVNTALVTYVSQASFESLEVANRSFLWSKTPKGW